MRHQIRIPESSKVDFVRIADSQSPSWEIADDWFEKCAGTSAPKAFSTKYEAAFVAGEFDDMPPKPNESHGACVDRRAAQLYLRTEKRWTIGDEFQFIFPNGEFYLVVSIAISPITPNLRPRGKGQLHFGWEIQWNPDEARKGKT